MAKVPNGVVETLVERLYSRAPDVQGLKDPMRACQPAGLLRTFNPAILNLVPFYCSKLRI